jgi:hypothetical protein
MIHINLFYYILQIILYPDYFVIFIYKFIMFDNVLTQIQLQTSKILITYEYS